MLDADGFERLRRRWERVVGDERPYSSWEADARREALEGGLRPDVERLARVAVRAGVADEPSVVSAAITALCQHLGRYRTYLPSDPAGAEALRHAYEAAAVAEPGFRPVLDQFVLAIAAEEELRTRWQQLTGPATAKGVEDRVFFRYFPLSTLNEVGGDPAPTLDRPIGVLHDLHDHTARAWPRTLLAGTTHDTKRSADVRARGLALAAHADRWEELIDAWEASGHAVLDPASAWLALQTAVTAGPIEAERLGAFLLKAAREAGTSTSWTDPNESYEAALVELATTVATWAPATTLATDLAPHGRAVSLALLAVRLTAPGVADEYQGSVLFQYLLTDPDNRAEPDVRALAATVARAGELDGPSAWAEPGAADARAVVLRRTLAARRAVGPLTGYQSLTVVGADAATVIGFIRRDSEDRPALATIVACSARLGTVHDAVAAIPGEWRSVLDDAAGPIADTIDVAAALTRFPAIVLTAANH